MLSGGSRWNRALPGRPAAHKLRWGSGGARSGAEPPPAGGASATPTCNPQGILRIRRNQPLQSMAAGFVCYPVEAGGTGHCPADQQTNFGGGLGAREAERSRPQPARRAAPARACQAQNCGLTGADFGRLNVWRPTVVDRMRGSKWPSALPTGLGRFCSQSPVPAIFAETKRAGFHGSRLQNAPKPL